MLEYKLTSKEHTFDSNFSYFTYGVAGYNEQGQAVVSFDDVSIERKVAENLVMLFNETQVSTVHFYDIIEDYLVYTY